MSKTYFLSMVGTSDPDGSGDWEGHNNGPLLACLLDQTSGLIAKDIVFDEFLIFHHDNPGKTQMLEKAKLVQERLQEERAGAVVHLVNLEKADTTDVDASQEAILAAVQSIIQPTDQTHINVSSGSIGFQAAWYTLASWGKLGKSHLYATLNPQFQGERPRVIPQGTRRFALEAALDRFQRAVEMDRLEQAAGHLLNAAESHSNPNKLESAQQFANLFSVLAALDAGGDPETLMTQLQGAIKAPGFAQLLPPECDELRRIGSEEHAIRRHRAKSVILLAQYGSLSRRLHAKDDRTVVARCRPILEGFLKELQRQHKGSHETLRFFDKQGDREVSAPGMGLLIGRYRDLKNFKQPVDFKWLAGAEYIADRAWVERLNREYSVAPIHANTSLDDILNTAMHGDATTAPAPVILKQVEFLVSHCLFGLEVKHLKSADSMVGRRAIHALMQRVRKELE